MALPHSQARARHARRACKAELSVDECVRRHGLQLLLVSKGPFPCFRSNNSRADQFAIHGWRTFLIALILQMPCSPSLQVAAGAQSKICPIHTGNESILPNHCMLPQAGSRQQNNKQHIPAPPSTRTADGTGLRGGRVGGADDLAASGHHIAALPHLRKRAWALTGTHVSQEPCSPRFWLHSCW